MGYPKVELIEEGMREGMQVESADISTDGKVALLDTLSVTGLKTIVVGSFVSPLWVPQMADVEEVIRRFTPRDGVCYTALALNERGRERMARYSPPLSPPPYPHRTLVHVCDVFVRRNTNRSQQDEIDALPKAVADAVAAGATTAGVALAAAFGSNWLGPFTDAEHMDLLELQWRLWADAGIPVSYVHLADSMGWNLPHRTESLIRSIRDRWPDLTTFHLHLHDARGTALTSAYTALRELDERHTVIIDAAIGGMGGCPYCGHGRMTRMIPTEDLVDLLHELGIETGVDLAQLIEAAALAEKVVGHELYGHVSKAGPRPRDGQLFAMDMPLVETAIQAQHFRLGPAVYAGARAPWKTAITSPRRPQIL